MASKLRLSALERPQKETSRVIVISMQVVPDKRGTLEDRLHLSQAVYRQLPGDDLTACGERREMIYKWRPEGLRNRLCHIKSKGDKRLK